LSEEEQEEQEEQAQVQLAIEISQEEQEVELATQMSQKEQEEEAEVQLCMEISARVADEGVSRSAGTSRGLSTPPCSPSRTRGDGEHASGGRAPSAPGQISARKAARALLQECGDELEEGMLL